MGRMMRELVVCIVVALSVHATASLYPRYGSFGKRSHIVGQNGLCLDIVKFDAQYVYTPTQLSFCEAAKQTQMWSILDDGTIRTKDNVNCLVPYNDAYEPKAVMGKCSELSRSVKKWNQKSDGTFVHESSGLVLTAKPNNAVVLGVNEYTPSQSWATTDGLIPYVVNIMWREDRCLQSMDNGAPFVYLNPCDKKNKNQHWALYPDGTIRADNHGNDRSYCLTSQGNPSTVILVANCENKATQRWGINEENFIYHPNTDLVMDVRNPEGSQIVVTNTRDGTTNQKWTIL